MPDQTIFRLSAGNRILLICLFFCTYIQSAFAGHFPAPSVGYLNTMNIFGKVSIDGQLLQDENDEIAIIDIQGDIRGLTTITTPNPDYNYYIIVNSDVYEEFAFILWDDSEHHEIPVTNAMLSTPIQFDPDQTVEINITAITTGLPVIEKITPNRTIGIGMINISGSNFYTNTTVTIDGIQSEAVYSSSTKLSVSVPMHEIGVANVMLTNPNGQTAIVPNGLTYVELPCSCPIPDSGPTKCYDNDSEMPCPEPGEPFYGQAGSYTINEMSFTKMDNNGNELPDDAEDWVMVRDNVTGLIWEVKQAKDGVQNYDNPNDADNRYAWYDTNPENNAGYTGYYNDGKNTQIFIEQINQKQLGGFSDWRMPSIKELTNIENLSKYDSTLDADYFPNTIYESFASYWSSTSEVYFDNSAWGVDFYSRRFSYNAKDSSLNVRAVRGKQHLQSFDYMIVNGDNTITNITNGIMWEMNTFTTKKTWESSMSYCEQLSLASYSDWRLPEPKELLSLVDFSRFNPSVNVELIPDTMPTHYWSSLTYVRYTSEAWGIYFYGGDISEQVKETTFYVRAVRGGQNRLFGNLFILSPDQASFWQPGNIMPIAWETQNIPGNVKVSLSREGGREGTYETIAITENDGTYDWIVTGDISVNCMLKIEPIDEPEKGTRQGLFTIHTYSTLKFQTVALSPVNTTLSDPSPFTLTSNYSTSDNTKTNGIGLRFHYNSSVVSLSSLENIFLSQTNMNPTPTEDTGNFDNDMTTDQYVELSWASLSSDWPSESQPVKLADLIFSAISTGQTTINTSFFAVADGYTGKSFPASLTIQSSAKIDIQSITQRMDGSGLLDIVFTGRSSQDLTVKFLKENCIYSTAPDFSTYTPLIFKTSDSAYTAYTPLLFSSGGNHYTAVVEASSWDSGNYYIQLGIDGDLSAVSDKLTIDNTPPAIPVILTNEGLDFKTSEHSILLTGTCAPDTYSIYVNTAGHGVTFTEGNTTWQYSGNLQPGVNTFLIEAIDVYGNKSASDVIQINLTNIIVFKAGDVSARAGTQVTIPIYISGIVDPFQSTAFGFNMHFDSSVLSYMSIDRSDTLADSFTMVNGAENEAGNLKIRGAYFGGYTIIDNGLFLKVMVQVKPDAITDTSIIFSDFKDDLYDASFEPASFKTLDVIAIPAIERNALIDIYNTTFGSAWTNHSNWLGNTGTECSWYGITCNDTNENVLAINLGENNLKGAIPESMNQLKLMQKIDLHGNMLENDIPASIIELTDLTDNQSDFRFNSLTTQNQSVHLFLNSKQINGNWDNTQTILPTDFVAEETTHSSIRLSWSPIAYTTNGYYQINMAMNIEGPFNDAAHVEKAKNSYTITNLASDTDYFFTIQTVSPAHASNPSTLKTPQSYTIYAKTNFINYTPSVPSSPDPENNANGISLRPVLSWTCSDLNPNDQLHYDVYFSTSDSFTTPLTNNIAQMSYSIESPLTSNTTYYWRIDATDQNGATTQGPTWEFKTMYVNTRPIISLIEGHSVYEDATGIIFLTATDAESAPCELSINIKSSDQSILSDNQISNTCYENNVTITALPEPNQHGTIVLTVWVSDQEGLTASTSFPLTVVSINDPPTINDIENRTLKLNSACQFSYTITDVDSTSLTVSATSSNLTLVAIENIVFTGQEALRSISITPTENITGTSIITLAVTDGYMTVTTSFELTVIPNIVDVCTSGACKYARIQDAVNAESSDITIIVHPGHYTETVVIGDYWDLNFKGEALQKNLNAQRPNHVVHLMGSQKNIKPEWDIREDNESLILGQVIINTLGSGVIINGFTIDGSSVDVPDENHQSGISALFIASGPDAIIEYNIIKNSRRFGVRNGYINGEGHRVAISNNTILSSKDTAILNHVANSDVTINNNNILNLNNTDGIASLRYEQLRSENIQILNNNIRNGKNGILIDAGSGAIVSRNFIEKTIGFAIITYSQSKISSNTVSLSKDGIRTEYAGTGPSDRVEITGNVISYIQYSGINVCGTHTFVSDNTLRHCNIGDHILKYFNNGTTLSTDWDYASIHVEAQGFDGGNSIIQNNTVSNGINGIQVWANNVTVRGNTLSQFGMSDGGEYSDYKIVNGQRYENSAILIGSNFGIPLEEFDPSGLSIQYHEDTWYNGSMNPKVSAISQKIFIIDKNTSLENLLLLVQDEDNETIYLEVQSSNSDLIEATDINITSTNYIEKITQSEYLVFLEDKQATLTLSLTPEIDQTGTAGISIVVDDNSNTFKARSEAQLFTVTVLPKDKPDFVDIVVSSYPKIGGKLQIDGNDVLLPFSQELAYGTAVSISAIPAENYTLKEWQGNIHLPDDANLTITAVQDIDITAIFNRAPYKPTVTEISVENKTVTITTDTFMDTEIEDEHISTKIKLWRDDQYVDNQYAVSPVEIPLPASTSAVIPESALSEGLKYRYQVGYQDSGSEMTSWSDEDTFIIGTPTSEISSQIPPGADITEYEMISFTRWPSQESAADLFAHLGVYEDDFRMGTYAPEIGNYIEYSDELTIEPGRAYWVLIRDGSDLALTGVPVSKSVDIDVALKFNPDNPDDGWNMIACPNDVSYRWGAIQILQYDENGNINVSPVSIANMQNTGLIKDGIYQWKHSEEEPYSFHTSLTFELYPNEGYWVKALKPNVFLRFPKNRNRSIQQTNNTVRQSYTDDQPPMPMSDNGIFKVTDSASGGCFLDNLFTDFDCLFFLGIIVILFTCHVSIRINNFKGFIPMICILICITLSFQSTSAKNTNNAIVHATHVNVRIGPSIEAPVVGRIVRKGTPIEIISEHNNWYYIHYDMLKKGWIFADFVTPLFQPEELEPEYVDRVIQAEKMPDKSISGRAYFDLGVFSFEEGDYQNAISNFEKAIQLNPDDPEFYHYMGKAYRDSKKYELSEKFLNDALKKDASLPDIQKDRAILFYKQNNYQSAARLFLEIIRKNPSDIMSTYYAANCLYKQRVYYQAGQLFQKAAKASPSLEANCLYYAGICHIKTGLPQKARQLLTKVQNNPKSGSLKEYASKWIVALDKIKGVKKPYFLFAQLGYQYDSNIRLEPIDEDLYTDEDDYCTNFLFSGNYTLADAKPYQVSAGMVYFRNVYSEYTQYNMDGSMIHLNTKLYLSPVKMAMKVMPSVFWLDSKKYLERLSISPSFSFQYHPQLTVILSFSNKFDNNLANDDRDANQVDNELTLQYVMPKKHLIFLTTVSHEIMNADNDMNDYDRFIARIGIRMQKLWGCSLGLSSQYEQKKFDLYDPTYDALREDFKSISILNIQRPIISPWLGIKTELKYTKSASNINMYNFERSSVTFSLTARH